MSPHLRVALVVSVFLAACNGTEPGLNGASTISNPTNETSNRPASEADGGPAGPTSPELPAPEEFVELVSNPYFPLGPGIVRIYEGDKEGEHRRDEVEVLAETRIIEGVECTSVHQEVFIDGELMEVTDEWFAQDDQGNVWKFGEESIEFETGEAVVDAWIAGEDGAEPWIFMNAEPKVGDVYFGGEDIYEVVSVNVIAVVPVAVFAHSIEVEENPDDPDDSDTIIFSPGAGMVSEASIDGTIELTEIR